MNPVVHFEMPAKDRKRMSQFYTKAFGWKTEQFGEDMGNYVMATTTASDKNGPKKPGAINGGFYSKPKDATCECTSLVISVEDLKAHIKKVEAAGGKVTEEPRDIPNVGMFVEFTDTEGNTLSMLQPKMNGSGK